MELPHRFTCSCCVPFDLMVSVSSFASQWPTGMTVSQVTERSVGRCGNERGETVRTRKHVLEGRDGFRKLTRQIHDLIFQKITPVSRRRSGLLLWGPACPFFTHFLGAGWELPSCWHQGVASSQRVQQHFFFHHKHMYHPQGTCSYSKNNVVCFGLNS